MAKVVPPKLKATGLILYFCLAMCANGFAHAAGSTQSKKVFVACSGNDLPGVRLCSAVRQNLQRATGFELVTSKLPLAFIVRLVSVGAYSRDSGISSVVTVIFTLERPDKTEMYLESSVYVVLTLGVNENEITETILSHLDSLSTHSPEP